MLGFQEASLPVENVIDGSQVTEPYFVLEGSNGFDLRSLKLLCEIIEKLVKDNDMGSLATKKEDFTLKSTKKSLPKMPQSELNKKKLFEA